MKKLGKYTYDCYDKNMKSLGIFFCDDTKELFEQCPNVFCIRAYDYMHGWCFKKVYENGVGPII